VNRRRLGTPNAEGPVTRRQLAAKSQSFNVANAVDALCQLIAKTESFAVTVDDLYEEIGDDRVRRHRLAWIVTEAANAAREALAASNKLAEDLVEHGVET